MCKCHSHETFPLFTLQSSHLYPRPEGIINNQQKAIEQKRDLVLWHIWFLEVKDNLAVKGIDISPLGHRIRYLKGLKGRKKKKNLFFPFHKSNIRWRHVHQPLVTSDYSLLKSPVGYHKRGFENKFIWLLRKEMERSQTRKVAASKTAPKSHLKANNQKISISEKRLLTERCMVQAAAAAAAVGFGSSESMMPEHNQAG